MNLRVELKKNGVAALDEMIGAARNELETISGDSGVAVEDLARMVVGVKDKEAFRRSLQAWIKKAEQDLIKIYNDQTDLPLEEKDGD